MTRVRPLARLRAVLAGLAVVLLTFSAAGAIVLVTAQVAHAAAVVITGPSPTVGINQNPTHFTGTGTVGDTVTLTGTLLTASPCSTGVTVDSGGNWACDANFSAPGGATNVTATQTGDGSTASNTYDVAFPPTAQLTLTSPGRYATNNPNLTIPGTDAIDLGTVHGTLTNGGIHYDCFYNTVSGPSFNCVGFTAIPNGDYTLQLTQKIGVATSLPTPAITVRIDTTASNSAPRFLSPYDSSGPNANVITSNPLMAVSGTYITGGVPEQYATVHVEADVEPGPASNNNGGTPSYCNAITDASGNWSCTPSTPLIFGDFYGFTVYGTDEAGNTGISPDPEFGVNVETPTPFPETQFLLLNQTNVELIGSGVAGGTVHGSVDNGQSCDAAVNSGVYECDFTISPATDGTYTVNLSQTAGTSTSPDVIITVVLDTTPPAGYPTFSAPWVTGSSPARAVTTNETVRFSGIAEANANVIVYVASDPNGYPADVTPDNPVCGATSDSEGNWSCQSSPGEGTSFGNSYSVGVQQLDQAHNAGPFAVATFELYVDAPPQTPTIVTPEAESASHLRSGDAVTFSGATAPGTTVRVYEGSTVLCQSFSSSGSWSCSIPTLPDGLHTVAALAVDSLGISSGATSRTFTVLPKAIARRCSVSSLGSPTPTAMRWMVPS